MPAEINIDGQKVNLGKEFEVGKGPIGLHDLLVMVRQSLSETSFGKAIESVLVRIEAGDTVALAALGVTIAMGLYVAYSIFTSEGESDPSSDGKQDVKEEEKTPPRDFTVEQLVR
jgi:hypothetical protein